MRGVCRGRDEAVFLIAFKLARSIPIVKYAYFSCAALQSADLGTSATLCFAGDEWRGGEFDQSHTNLSHEYVDQHTGLWQWIHLERFDAILFAMIQLLKYTSHNLPLQLRWQIYSFIRMEWPKAFPATQAFFTHQQFQAVHFVFVDNDVLISHVAVCWKMLPHEGHTYKTYGLASVMTFPDYRNQGYGLRVVAEAKKYMEQTDGDIVLFHSDQVGFYEKAGFEWVENVKLLKGKPDHPIQDDERPYMLFLSEKAKLHRSDFSKPVYFGEEVW